MPVAGPALGEGVRQMLDQRGIHFHPSHKLMAVNSDTRELLFDGSRRCGTTCSSRSRRTGRPRSCVRRDWRTKRMDPGGSPDARDPSRARVCDR